MNVKSWLVTVGLSLTVIAALAAFKVQQIQAAIAFGESYPEHSETVEANTAQLADYQGMIELTATVKAPKRLSLYTQAAGVITQLPFAAGSQVAAGDLLLQLDVSEEQAQLEALQARLSLAQSLYQRGLRLKQAKALSQEALDQRFADMKVLQADVLALHSQIKKKAIYAQFDGVLGLFDIEQGQYLNQGAHVTSLIAVEQFYDLDFVLPPFYPALKPGTTIRVARIQHEAKAAAKWFEATIIAQQAEVSRSSLGLPYRAHFDRQALAAHHGMVVAVQVPIAEKQRLIKLNKLALQQDPLGQFVYVLTQDEQGQYRAKRRNIELEAQTATHIFLKHGLSEGALVADKGAFKLYPGVLVNVANKKGEG